MFSNAEKSLAKFFACPFITSNRIATTKDNTASIKGRLSKAFSIVNIFLKTFSHHAPPDC